MSKFLIIAWGSVALLFAYFLIALYQLIIVKKDKNNYINKNNNKNQQTIDRFNNRIIDYKTKSNPYINFGATFVIVLAMVITFYFIGDYHLSTNKMHFMSQIIIVLITGIIILIIGLIKYKKNKKTTE